MKKNKRLMEALNRGFEIEELQDPHLRSITGGCGPMGGGTNFNCNPSFNEIVGNARAEAACPHKAIFTGTVGREF